LLNSNVGDNEVINVFSSVREPGYVPPSSDGLLTPAISGQIQSQTIAKRKNKECVLALDEA
jgi:hypothetical protein